MALGVEVYFTRIGDFTWRVSDCEELVGDKFLNRFMTDYFTQKFHSVLDQLQICPLLTCRWLQS